MSITSCALLSKITRLCSTVVTHVSRFPQALEKEEIQPSYDLKAALCCKSYGLEAIDWRKLLFLRLCEMQGMQMSNRFLNFLYNDRMFFVVTCYLKFAPAPVTLKCSSKSIFFF